MKIVKTRHPRRWSKADLKKLKSMMDEGVKVSIMTVRLRRSEASVRQMICIVKREMGVGGLGSAPAEWSAEEDERLLHLYRSCVLIKHIALIMGRTRHAIGVRLRELNYKK